MGLLGIFGKKRIKDIAEGITRIPFSLFFLRISFSSNIFPISTIKILTEGDRAPLAAS